MEYGTIILHSELVEIKCATTKVGIKATSSTILEKPGCTLIHRTVDRNVSDATAIEGMLDRTDVSIVTGAVACIS